ncbi:hypothetical protein K503DRAFT_58956 [Rhizopogon vinicolor AM-OR11-026]|uniref:Uncharacterized protein n=1 Tax=Rhizopogon vinicolor AM-OR11-026 TaxID=1314800 RepID=A0A1B7N4F3_9AGAM|nr:hypothetical protein K503DRAFT_58956 [Rhizopogon vinicolor AM-OR11-026]
MTVIEERDSFRPRAQRCSLVCLNGFDLALVVKYMFLAISSTAHMSHLSRRGDGYRSARFSWFMLVGRICVSRAAVSPSLSGSSLAM